MAWGMRVWDENGQLICDYTDKLARLVYSVVKDGKTSGSEYIPEADGKMSMLLTFPTANNTSDIELICTLENDGTLSWITPDPSLVMGEPGETQICVYVCE